MESLVLSPQDVENLEAMSDGSTGYFYKMLDYLEKRVEDGVRRGRFSEEAAKADLETALWYSYACNNLDEYESYCRAAQWMAASEGSAEAARCGMWYVPLLLRPAVLRAAGGGPGLRGKGSGGGAGLCVGLATTGQAAQPLW